MVKFKGLKFCGWQFGKDFCNQTLVHMYQSDGEYPDKGKTVNNICLTSQKFCVDINTRHLVHKQTNKQTLSGLPDKCLLNLVNFASFLCTVGNAQMLWLHCFCIHKMA